MFTETDLQELLAYPPQHPVLSVYLNTDPKQGSADVYKLNLRSMLKDIDLSSEVTSVENFFSRSFDWSGRGVAVFSCAPDNFIRAYTMAVPVGNQVVVGKSPYVKPLVSLLDYYGGYGVILVDKQGARLFSFHLGELREQEGFLGENIRHTKRGGASAKPGMRGGMAGQTRYEDEVTDRNIRDIAEFAANFFNENNIRRVLIGGTDENIAGLRSHLPKSWQSLIVGTFPMSMTASQAEVLERALHIGKQAEFQKEETLVKILVTGTAKDKKGVIGLEPTLVAVHEGRVQTLIIQDGFCSTGHQCKDCGYLTTIEVNNCCYCGADFEKIPDVVEMAAHKVMKSGGDFEILHHEHHISGFANIGALLRY